MSNTSGRHFLQVPGPSNVPDRILRAIARPTIDHRGPEFGRMALEILENLKPIFKTKGKVMIFPSSGTGAWEAGLVNTLSPGDKVLMFETGQFATLWKNMAADLGLDVQFEASDWRRGADPEQLDSILRDDRNHAIKAVCVVHNETSSAVTNSIPMVRKAMDRAKHPALLMVDTISSLASMDFRFDEWQVDVAVAGSQKGLMLPPGLGFNAVSEKALAASKSARLPKSYWDWQAMLGQNKSGFFPYTPATNLLYGLRESIAMLNEEGLENVFERHTRHGEATRRAVRAWGLEVVCADPERYSSSVTAVFVPPTINADEYRKVVLENFNMSLGSGLGKLAGKAFRIGHLGDFNDLMLAGTLSGVEMGLALAGVPHSRGGVAAALEYLTQAAQDVREQAVQAVLETAAPMR
ncbi:MAG TPA: aminotransferase class V-fold PLP-dependent enzyme [Bryobacteraceae bacterium]|nr:aminotransferase class V-fold PLP-dependent enzyme [Bryobacteraceae bacterium]